MCGIFAVIERTKRQGDYEECLELLDHRGPDNLNFVNKQIGEFSVFLGHTRLSIIDVSENANQPLVKDEVLLIFNGEIFNFKELATELGIDNPVSDTHVLLDYYLAKGGDIFNHLNGFWSFVLLDLRHGNAKVIISRDRLGVKPLYYSNNKNRLIISSEIKPIFKTNKVKKEIDYDILAELIATDYSVKETNVFYKNIKEFPPKSSAVLELCGELSLKNKINQYWSPKLSTNMNRESKALSDLDEILEVVLTEWMRSDVPIALSLSGGVDSSLIALACKKFGFNKDLVAFSSVFPGTLFDESEYAEFVAEKTSIKLNKITPNFDDIVREVESFSAHQELLVTSFSQMAAWSIFKEIKQAGYKITITGQAGDELFLGYDRYISASMASNSTIKTFWELGFSEFVNYLAFWKIPNVRIMRNYHKTKKLIDCNKKRIHQYLKIKGKNALKEIQFNEAINPTQLRRLLRFDDRSSSAFSIEARPLFTDHRIVEFALSLSSDLLIKNGETKYILKQYLRKNGLSEIADRKDKLGFPVPNHAWAKQFYQQFAPRYHSKYPQSRLLQLDDKDLLDPWVTNKAAILLMSAFSNGWS